MALKPGTTFVSGRSPEVARSLLAAAARVGMLPEFIRTTQGGYIVPDAVADALTADSDPDAQY